MGWRSHLGEHSAGGGQCAVLSWSLDPAAEELAECTVLALMRREAGVLLAVPIGFIPDSVLAEGALGSEESIFGPQSFHGGIFVGGGWNFVTDRAFT